MQQNEKEEPNAGFKLSVPGTLRDRYRRFFVTFENQSFRHLLCAIFNDLSSAEMTPAKHGTIADDQETRETRETRNHVQV